MTKPARTSVGGGWGWGWGTHILPYVEEMTLYTHLAPSGTNFPAAPTDLTRTTIAVFNCPSEATGAFNTAEALGGGGTSKTMLLVERLWDGLDGEKRLGTRADGQQIVGEYRSCGATTSRGRGGRRWIAPACTACDETLVFSMF